MYQGAGERHGKSGVFSGDHSCVKGFADETSAVILSPQKRLVGERVVVKEIEIFGNF